MTGAQNDQNGETLEIPLVPKKYLGLLGNMPDVDPHFLTRSFWNLADLYGPIIKLELNRPVILLSNYEFIHDASDDDRFEKYISGPNLSLRDSLGDALFTARSDEKVWWQAHRILVPVFGPMGVKKMFDKQLDIASQMILKWDRMGPDHAFVVADDFTRLAFDTIGLCAFNHRFNEFYSDDVHPFAQHMANALLQAGARSIRTPIQNKLRNLADRRYWNDIDEMNKLCDSIIDERVKNPQPEIDDLLNVMLNTEDPETHEKLSSENVRYQMTTFLSAGHETTSGTLTFLFYHLLTNPETYHKAQAEVDEVLGDNAITYNHLSKLKYVDACIKEALRFEGPLTVFTRRPKKPTVLAGKYAVETDTDLACVMKKIHRDPAVWGDDADQFRPERMIPFDPAPGSWIPFGVGIRSCIGRTFAWQEMLISIALILQRFQVELADPNYVLQLKSTLTIKPAGLELRVRRRPGKADMVGLQNQGITQEKKHKHDEANGGEKKPLTVLYGSNAGTCKAFADELVAEATGFNVTVQTLDTATEHVPTDQPVVIVCPSYEGKPADNAKKFVSWLEQKSSAENLLKDVRYSIFGVGNSEWKSTFHKVPELIDELFSKLGATRFMDCGFVDVKNDPVGPWEDYLEKLLSCLGGEGKESRDEVTTMITESDSSTTLVGPKLLIGTIKDSFLIADNSVGPPKMHTEIELPKDIAYKTGDYLSILAHNSNETVRRVARRFGVSLDDSIVIKGSNKAHLKTSTPISIMELLGVRLELNTPITQRQLSKLASFTDDTKEKASLEEIGKDEKFKKSILPKRFSIIDILEDYPNCTIPFAAYLNMLKPMAMRQYSIASSPLSEQNMSAKQLTATLVYDVHTAPSYSHPSTPFQGVASCYLASLKPGARVHCMVSTTNNSNFRLPRDSSVPIIMIAAGTGLAPMRGFLEERAALLAADKNRKLGPALLYFGCRDFESDYIHRHELERWEKLGVVQVRPVFSKHGPTDQKENWKHVPDRIYSEADEVAELFNQPGAKLFLCGSTGLANSTAEVCKKIYQERRGVGEQEAARWFEKIREERYVSDVFG